MPDFLIYCFSLVLFVNSAYILSIIAYRQIVNCFFA
nr:MAG TPA: hypothetical protein [Caudoviricetes sp.]